MITIAFVTGWAISCGYNKSIKRKILYNRFLPDVPVFSSYSIYRMIEAQAPRPNLRFISGNFRQTV
jgi:hypothetical protein